MLNVKGGYFFKIIANTTQKEKNLDLFFPRIYDWTKDGFVRVSQFLGCSKVTRDLVTKKKERTHLPESVVNKRST